MHLHLTVMAVTRPNRQKVEDKCRKRPLFSIGFRLRLRTAPLLLAKTLELRCLTTTRRVLLQNALTKVNSRGAKIDGVLATFRAQQMAALAKDPTMSKI